MERALYTDAIFFKDPLDKKENKTSLRSNKVVFLAALLIGYYDFALELAQQCIAKDNTNELTLLRNLIKEISGIKPESTIESVKSLHNKVNNNPELANVIVGNFVDSRRKFNDYDDILNVSPLPKTL